MHFPNNHIESKLRLLNFFLVSLTIMACGLLFSYLTIQSADSQLEKLERAQMQALISKGELITNNNGNALTGMIANFEVSAVHKLVVLTVNKDPEILYGVFIDPDLIPWAMSTSAPKTFRHIFGKQTASFLQSQNGEIWANDVFSPIKPLDDELSKSMGTISKQTRKKLKDETGQGIYEFIAPVTIEEEIVGHIRYGLSTAQFEIIQAQLQKDVNNNIIEVLVGFIQFGIAILVMCFFIIRYYAQKITTPIQLLSTTMAKITSGDYDKPVKIQSDDEVGVLADHFEMMRLSIKSRIVNLNLMNKTIQQFSMTHDHEQLLQGFIDFIHASDRYQTCSMHTTQSSNNFFSVVKGCPRDMESRSLLANLDDQAPSLLLIDDIAVIPLYSESGKKALAIELISTQENASHDHHPLQVIAKSYQIQANNLMLQKTIIQQNKNLEIRVVERTQELSHKTKDLQTMLDNIDFGIASVLADGALHPEHSKVMNTLFGDFTPEETSVVDLLLPNNGSVEEARSILVSSLSSIVEESEMMFSFNEHLLIRRIERERQGNRQILELNWFPIVYDDTVEKLLLCVRDVTEIERHNQLRKENSSEVEILQAILNQQGLSLKSILKDTQLILQKYEQFDLTTLKVKLHTVKGNARALKLKTLSQEIHGIETRIQEQGNTTRALKKIMEPLKALYSVMQKVLSRALDKSPTHMELCDIICESYSALKPSAELLRIPTPRLEMFVPQITLTEDTFHILLSTLNHIFANMICHGIEPPEERVAKNKTAYATIKAVISNTDATLVQLTLSDDGRGLNLSRLGLQRGTDLTQVMNNKDHDTMKSLQQCADVVFDAGVSTAPVISELSGRGIGMSAVKESLNSLGGEIKITIENEDVYLSNGEYFAPFYFEIDLPCTHSV